MNIDDRYIFKFVSVGIISLLLVTEAVAATEFFLLLNDVQRKVECDYLEIKNNQALCTSKDLLITYDLEQIKKLEVVNKGGIVLFPELYRKNDKKN